MHEGKYSFNFSWENSTLKKHMQESNVPSVYVLPLYHFYFSKTFFLDNQTLEKVVVFEVLFIEICL